MYVIPDVKLWFFHAHPRKCHLSLVLAIITPPETTCAPPVRWSSQIPLPPSSPCLWSQAGGGSRECMQMHSRWSKLPPLTHQTHQVNITEPGGRGTYEGKWCRFSLVRISKVSTSVFIALTHSSFTYLTCFPFTMFVQSFLILSSLLHSPPNSFHSYWTVRFLDWF